MPFRLPRCKLQRRCFESMSDTAQQCRRAWSCCPRWWWTSLWKRKSCIFPSSTQRSSIALASHLSWRTLFSATASFRCPQKRRPGSTKCPWPRTSRRTATSCRSCWWCTWRCRWRESQPAQPVPASGKRVKRGWIRLVKKKFNCCRLHSFRRNRVRSQNQITQTCLEWEKRASERRFFVSTCCLPGCHPNYEWKNKKKENREQAK